MVLISEEIDLHRLTVDEAIPKLDDFLHAAFQAGLYRVWVNSRQGFRHITTGSRTLLIKTSSGEVA